MKRIFTIVLVLLSMGAMAQQYNNEWIDFSKTYYKFKVVTTGLYRIPQTTLNTAGLGSIPAEQFKLFRNGKEVSLHTSVASGVLPSNGFIEFWGEGNDGKADKPLYRDPAFQHTDKVSLQTDTAVYFLTVNTGTNKRYQAGVNDVAGNSLAAEPYFMHTAGRYFREKINHGFAAVIGEHVYSSSYDKGEFWSTNDIMGVNGTRTDQQLNLNVFAGGPAATLRYGAVGDALNTRTVKVRVNGTDVRESVMDYFNDTLTEAAVPASLISSGTANISFINTSTTGTDRMVISFYELIYARRFNFGGAKNFEFTLPGKADGYYLTITNFSHGTQPVYLYDQTYGERIQAVVSAVGDTLKFALSGSTAERKFTLVSHETSNIRSVTSLTPKTFVNYNTTANQGDYLIISSPLLYNGTGGVNPVDEYRKYRNATGYNTKIYEIDDLVDQFAFGIKKHPLSVKNFIRFARNKFAVTPRNVFMIGRGVAYNEYRQYQSDPLADRLNIIPSFGFPASDNMLSADEVGSSIVTIPIGRLSVVIPKEIEDYLEKVKEYEDAQKNSPNTIDGRLWMKSAIHVTGASDAYLGTVLCNYMEAYKHILQDTLAGVQITVFCKSSTSEGEALSNDRIADLFEDGLSLVTYFGHSSATTLEFNLDNPQNYNNKGKYPVFSVNGCNAGNFFTFDNQRFTFNETLSEKFTLAKQRGGIAFIASTHYGIVNYLNIFINTLYANMGKDYYGRTLGEINKAALQTVVNVSGTGDYYARLHAEEVTLHGDPALVMNFQPKPDYVIEEPQVKISPAFISIAEDSFDVAIKAYNLGKAVDDSITVEVKREYPDKSSSVILQKKIKAFYYSDSMTIRLPIVATRDKGTNKLIITFDSENRIDEMSEGNNSITKEFFVYEDEARPAFPYAYSIVNTQSQKLYISTANPFSNLKQYAIEIDTTELFNSSMKVVKTISSVGGVIEVDPGISFKDSTVYYWRASFVPAAGGDYRWNGSSFTYINGSSAGFSQGHYFQHLKSTAERVSLAANRKWKYGLRNNSLFIRNAIYPYSGTSDSDFSVSINNDTYIYSACEGLSLIFHVFDATTFKPWKNVDAGGNNLHLYGSTVANCGLGREYNLEFSYMTPASRKKIMDFMDAIPDGSYVAVRNIPLYYQSGNKYAKDWRADTTLYGSNNSLYHKLYSAGLTAVDSFNQPRVFAFVYKKGDPTYVGKFKFSDGIYDRVVLPADCPSPDTIGYIYSPKFGPAKNWKQLHWRGGSDETPTADNPTVDVIGVDNANRETVLFTVNKTQQELDISSISATQYPYVKLKMRNIDSVKLTPYQLRYWQLDYDPIPEGALAPNIFFTPNNKDTMDIGDKYSFGIAFKNIGQAAFDSIKVKFVITDQDNVPHTIELPKRKPLVSGDTTVIRYEIDTKDYPGLNTLYVDFNPDNHQQEQFHYNNFMFRNFYVRPDNINPLLDVTFDGVHILNRDIVSSKPHIQIKLKDEAKFMLLTDTSLITTLQVKFPDAAGTIRTYKFGTDTLRFTPAVNGTANEATVDFMPYFPALKDANGDPINPDGDEYELIIKAKDKSGNKAGNVEYRVTFKIIDKPMISNLLNYPNPFTTSTAFVFTITGSEIPSNMKIQILTVTGKIVREITKDELGPLRIGRNITEFKWDGTDQYGQRLANGVYLYRVVTTLNGRQMEKYKAEGDETDKFFTRGYGKMYLMK